MSEPRGETLLAFEHVSKSYPPPPPMRLRRFFSRFRGLHLDDGFGDTLGGDDDDDDDLFDDDADEAPVTGPVGDGHLVLNDVSVRLMAGSLVGLIGPLDGGKSVFLKLASGVIAPSTGRIVVRGSVAPAMGFMQLVLPGKGHLVKAALPQLGAMVGVSPARVRDSLDAIGELMQLPNLPKMSPAFMESRQKRELVLAMAICLEPDVLLLDTPIMQTAFGERCAERIHQLRDRGSLVVAEMRNVRKSPALTVDSVIALKDGRVVDPAPWTPPEARHLLEHVDHD